MPLHENPIHTPVRSGGGDAVGALDTLGLDGARVARVLIALSRDIDKVSEATRRATDEWERNSARTEEVAKRLATAESQIKLAGQQFNDLGITIGGALVPHLVTLAQSISNIVTPIGNWLQQHETLTSILVPAVAVIGTLSLVLQLQNKNW